MILRHYVNGIKINGLDISVDGLQLTIGAGSIEVSNGIATLTESVTLEFPPADTISDIQIGFDNMGRLYVDRHDRGQPKERALRFGTLTHYIYFTIHPNTTDLADIPINVLRQPPV